METTVEPGTKACPFCRELVRQDAIKCRYCGSTLLPLQPTENKAADAPLAGPNQIVYVLDRDLIRFGKFSGAILTLFFVVGTFFFGFNLKETSEEVRSSKEAARESAQAAEADNEDIKKTKDSVEAERAEAERLQKAVGASMEAVEEQSKSVRAAADEVEKSRKSVAAGEASVSNALSLVQNEQRSMTLIQAEIDKARQNAMDSQQQAQASLKEAQALVSTITEERDTAQKLVADITVTTGSKPSSGGNGSTAELPKKSFTAPELARFYDFPSELNGQGQTIGLIELGGGYTNADLDAYFTSLGLKTPPITVVSVDGGGNHPGSMDSMDAEVTMEIEVSGSVASAAHLVVYFAVNTNAGFLDAITRAVSDQANPLSVLLICWGAPEANWDKRSVYQINDMFSSATAKGITVVSSPGGTVFPPTSPLVLSIGGTKLQGSGGTLVETKYAEGGMSKFFARPSWQTVTGTPAAPGTNIFQGRLGPDVSADADPDSGYKIQLHGSQVVVGGSMAAASLWAGFVALINQSLGRNVGYLNPLIYSSLGPGKAFRQVQQAGQASEGWQPDTGWGSPDGRKLIDAIRTGASH